jgi:outer membrane lipoprotein SlyB
MLRRVLAPLALVGTLALGACATQPGPYSYSPYEAGMMARVEEGTVVSVRPVRFNDQQPGSGMAVGGLAGAAVGSQFGGDTGGHIIGALIGGMLGMGAGKAIEDGNVGHGFAYTIRRQGDGSLFEVAQVEPQPIPVGSRVHITYGDRVRIVPVY